MHVLLNALQLSENRTRKLRSYSRGESVKLPSDLALEANKLYLKPVTRFAGRICFACSIQLEVLDFNKATGHTAQ